MKVLHVLGMVFFSLLAIGGFVTANGATGNLVAGCDCVSSACIQVCGDSPNKECCMNQDEEQVTVPEYPKIPSYAISFLGLGGFFYILAMDKPEEEFY